MVLTIKVPLQDSETIREYLVKHNMFEKGYQYAKANGYIYFPVSARFEIPGRLLSFEERDLKPSDRGISWRDAARSILSPVQHASGRFSYDTVGTIAIVEIVEELEEHERELAELLLRTVPSLKTVLKKLGGHEGEFRVQKMGFLAGEDTRETIVKENGCSFMVNVENVYYSVRLGTERTRIMHLIRPGERVLCMFSGVAPYPIVFAKNTQAKELVGIEINPEAHKLALENVKLNKVDNVTLICGDVKDETPKLVESGKRFDRITMPLPHTGEEFLPVAFDAIAPGGTIHYYAFLDKGDLRKEKGRVADMIMKAGKRGKVVKSTLCGQYSPRRYRVCFDIEVLE